MNGDISAGTITVLRHADRITATFGFNAPVAIDVAIALAVSWKPFVKSNESPRITTRTRTKVDPMARAASHVAPLSV
jgi:hypothetical protein